MTLLTGTLLKNFVLSLSLCDIFGTMVFRWNKKDFRFEPKSSSNRTTNYRLFYLAIFSGAIVILQAVLLKNVLSRFVIFYTFFILSSCSVTYFCARGSVRWPSLICGLLNSMISFEKRCSDFRLRTMSKTFEKVLPLFASGSVLPIWYSLGAILYPCLPTYSGSLILESCAAKWQDNITSQVAVSEYLLRICIALFTFLTWCFGTPNTMIHFCMAFAQGHCFKEYIEGYVNNVADSTNLPNRKIRRMVKTYREIQLMMIQHRQIVANNVIVAAMLPGPFLQIMANYLVIDYLRREEDTPVEAVVMCGSVSLIMFGVLSLTLRLLASVNRVSKHLTKRVGKNVRNKEFRKFLKSCSILKVHVGEGGNCIEPKTPLIVEHFVVNQTVSLLLLDKS